VAQRELIRAADILAAHAVLLLGAGVLAALIALAMVVAAIRLARRHRDPIRRGVAALVQAARAVPAVDRAISRTGALVPSGYLVLHLAFGLVLTAAISIFIVVAAHVVGGGEVTTWRSRRHCTTM
jgi:hypothetical protein